MHHLVKQNQNPDNPNRGRLVTPTLLILLSAIVLPSCGSPTSKINAKLEMANTGTSMGYSASMAAPPAPAPIAIPAPAQVVQAQAEAPRAQPQLIKKAALTLEVESIDKSIQTVSDIVKKHQGDLLNFEDRKPQTATSRHTASMQIRVPQQQLETTINALAKLGTVQSRSLTAEDVSDQLVDNEARLKNLRKSEEMVLKIMERSGSVGDVLNAAQNLSNIRENIERIDAQLKNLRNQVAYSTISLNLEAPVSASQTSELSLGKELQKTWGNATGAVGSLGVGLLKLSIYLLVFSPFVLLLVGGVVLGNRIKKQKS